MRAGARQFHVPWSPHFCATKQGRGAEFRSPKVNNARLRRHGARRGHPQAPALRQRGRGVPQGAALPPGHVAQGLPRRAPGAQGVSISTALLPAGRRRRRGGEPRRPLERRGRRPEREPAAEPLRRRGRRVHGHDDAERPDRSVLRRGAAEPAPPRRRAGLRVPVRAQGEPAVRADGLRADGLRGRAAGYSGAARLEAGGLLRRGQPVAEPAPAEPPRRRSGLRVRGRPSGPDVQDAPLRLPAGRVPARRSM